MKAATELARRILEKEEASRRTKSAKMKTDLGKSIRRDKNELQFYCRNRGLSLAEVFKAAKK